VAAHGGAQSIGNIARRRGRSAKERYELVPAGMRDELPLTKIGPHQIEDRAKNQLGVVLTKTLGEPPIVVDVGDEQRNGPASRTRLGDGSRRSVDEGVVGSEPTLLIEKNEMLLRAGRSRFTPESDIGERASTTVRARGRMTQEKKCDLCRQISDLLT
jgi:hypothetical protein